MDFNSGTGQKFRAYLYTARKAIQEAEILHQHALYHGMYSRLYQACFFLIKAHILISSLKDYKTHRGTANYLYHQLILKNLLDKAYCNSYQYLYDMKQLADKYAIKDWGYHNPTKRLSEVIEFAQKMEGLIRKLY